MQTASILVYLLYFNLNDYYTQVLQCCASEMHAHLNPGSRNWLFFLRSMPSETSPNELWGIRLNMNL